MCNVDLVHIFVDVKLQSTKPIYLCNFIPIIFEIKQCAYSLLHITNIKNYSRYVLSRFPFLILNLKSLKKKKLNKSRRIFLYIQSKI